MSWLIHNADGHAVSIGTVLADPLPAGLTAVDLTDADYTAVRSGAKRWDAATLALVDVTPSATPPSADEKLAALLAALADAETLGDVRAAAEAAAGGA